MLLLMDFLVCHLLALYPQRSSDNAIAYAKSPPNGRTDAQIRKFMAKYQRYFVDSHNP